MKLRIVLLSLALAVPCGAAASRDALSVVSGAATSVPVTPVTWPVVRPAPISAQEAPREIAALLSLLRSSTCRFERNGRWYDGERAAEHLQRKLDYATGRGMAPASAEEFIEKAATRSSFSGREYRVQCGDAVAIPARTWFVAALKQLRSG